MQLTRSWGLITSLHGKQIWKKVETVADFIFLGSKITVEGDLSHKMKRCLILGRKAMTNLDSMSKKQRHQFAHKGPCSQSYLWFFQ